MRITVEKVNSMSLVNVDELKQLVQEQMIMILTNRENKRKLDIRTLQTVIDLLTNLSNEAFKIEVSEKTPFGFDIIDTSEIDLFNLRSAEVVTTLVETKPKKKTTEAKKGDSIK